MVGRGECFCCRNKRKETLAKPYSEKKKKKTTNVYLWQGCKRVQIQNSYVYTSQKGIGTCFKVKIWIWSHRKFFNVSYLLLFPDSFFNKKLISTGQRESVWCLSVTPIPYQLQGLLSPAKGFIPSSQRVNICWTEQ